ncbi:unnamed protein product [Phyllotreta striolata]|uniref:Uncharacterized protein n=1 Tax=Phyllotreta striolata TaxID=444603 RepID=A0A9N9TN20_PHYSR|nr:unnamed protein product [Phyllotreta striolata]
MDPQIEAHDDIDIYEELDDSEYDLGTKIENCQKENEELQKHIESQEANLIRLKEALEVVQEEKGSLEKNLSSLLKTAKSELERKDAIIADLQRQLDNITFRRISNFRNRNINVDKNRDNNVNNIINENVDSKLVDDKDHNRNIFSDRQGPAVNNKMNATNPSRNENYGFQSKEYNKTEHTNHYENLKNTNSRSRPRTADTITNDNRHSSTIESKEKIGNEENYRDKNARSRSKDRTRRVVESTNNKIDTSSKDYIENKHRIDHERNYDKSRKENANYTNQTEKYNSNYTENTSKETKSRSKSKERAKKPETITNDKRHTNSKDFESKNRLENEESEKHMNQIEEYAVKYSDCFDKVFEDIKSRSKSRDSMRSFETSLNDKIETNSKDSIKCRIQIENEQKYDKRRRDKSRSRGEYEQSHNKSRDTDVSCNSHVERDKSRENNNREYRYNNSRKHKFVGDLRDHIERRKSRDTTENEQWFEQRQLEGGHRRDVSPGSNAITKDQEDTRRVNENLEPKPKKISVKDYLQKQSLLRTFTPPIESLPKEQLTNGNAKDTTPKPVEETNILNHTLENVSSDESFSHMDEVEICELKKKIINELLQEQRSKNIPEEKKDKPRRSPRSELKSSKFKNDTQKADTRNELEQEQKTSKNASRLNRDSSAKKENVQTKNDFKETCREHKGDNSTIQSFDDESGQKSISKNTRSVTKSVVKPVESPQKSFSPLENVYALQDEHEKANYTSRRTKCSQITKAPSLSSTRKSSERPPEPEKTILSTHSNDQQQTNLKNKETNSQSDNITNKLNTKSQLVIEKNDCESKSSKETLDEVSMGNISDSALQKVSAVAQKSPLKNNKRKRKSASPIKNNSVTKKKVKETNIERTSKLEDDSNQLVEPSITNVELNNSNNNIIILSDVTIHSERPNMPDNSNKVENDLILSQAKSTTKCQEESNATEMQDTTKSTDSSDKIADKPIPKEIQDQRSPLDLSSSSPNRKIEIDKAKNLEEEINKIREKQSLEINNPPKKRKVEFDLNDQKQRQIEDIEQQLKLMHDVEEKQKTPVKRKYSKRVKTETITVRRKSLRQMKNSTPGKLPENSDADLKPSEPDKASTDTIEKSATDLPLKTTTNEKPVANSNTNSYVSPTSDQLLKTRKRITPTPVKEAPVCSFKNILDKNKTGFKIFSKNLVMESTLNLTDEGDIPLLHIEENHFNNMEDATQKTFDRSIMNLLDTMNVSNLECNMSKLNESVDNKEVNPKPVEEAAKIAISTPISKQERVVSPGKIPNSSIQNSSKPSLSNSTSAPRRYRRICRIIAVKKS